MVSVLTDIPGNGLLLSRVSSTPVLLPASDDSKTVEEMGLCNYDSLVAEYRKENGLVDCF